MNPYKHAEISVQKRGGKIEDYYPIHSFMDSTKELCSDNRHRILHNLWGIRRVVIPIFGAVIVNSDGKEVNVKDLCEQDHVLPDYRNKFIPNLSDFTSAISDDDADLQRFDAVIKQYQDDAEVCQLLLSPLAITGQLKSLLITHNSWFLNEILPQVLKRRPLIQNFGISPDMLFTRMEFRLWMNNGQVMPDGMIDNLDMVLLD